MFAECTMNNAQLSPGKFLKHQPKDSEGACRDWCYENPECYGWTFHKSTPKRCALKTKEQLLIRTDKPEWVSGKKKGSCQLKCPGII